MLVCDPDRVGTVFTHNPAAYAEVLRKVDEEGVWLCARAGSFATGALRHVPGVMTWYRVCWRGLCLCLVLGGGGRWHRR